MLVAVGILVGLCVGLDVGVGVGLDASVGVEVGRAVRVAVGLDTGVWVKVGRGVGVGARVTVAVGVPVEVGVLVAVQAAVAVRGGLAIVGDADGLESSIPTTVTVRLTRADVGSTVTVIASWLGAGLELTICVFDEPGQGRRIKKTDKSNMATAAKRLPTIVKERLRFGAGSGGEMASEPSPVSVPVATL